jgi:hypothetical protein
VISTGSATGDRCVMQVIRDRNIRTGMLSAGKQIRQEHMHPDDFEAHLAWVTAKAVR